jgi:L,D-peptidoglycan transpeptidase YkuD (ErfK/YbiS/YcfS/YnhG family)
LDSVAVVGADGMLRMGRHVMRARLGRAGITPHKQEGDGATPAGLLPLRRVLYRADRIARPRSVVPIEPLSPEDGWCDDPAHPHYNTQVRLPHAGRCEELWRRDPLYDLVGVLGWNDRPVERGRGSAIFLHVAAADGGPTAGCVALALGELVELLAAGLDGVRVV